MDGIESWIGTIGGIVGILSALVTVHQWWKVNKKIAMLNDASKVAEVLPAWYTERMMKDDWLFGLLTSDGRTIAIRRITAVSDDAKWMDVELATAEQAQAVAQRHLNLVSAVADDRSTASIQIATIVTALDLQTGRHV